MKKILAVFLAALMICSAFSFLAFAEDKYPAPAQPANLALSAYGIASWDAVEIPAYTEMENYETSCAIEYKVTLSRWDYDDDKENWVFVPVTDEIVTEETSVDLSDYMVSGKYIFAVTAVAKYERTMHTTDNNGNPVDKIAVFRKLSDKVELEKEKAVKITPDLYEEPIDDSIPFESLVKEDDETANSFLKLLKKIKTVFLTILRFLGFAGDVTGISDEIN